MFAIIEEEKCSLLACGGRVCQAKGKCPTKALWQPEPGESPFMDSGRCTGCRKCLQACPMRAIKMV